MCSIRKKESELTHTRIQTRTDRSVKKGVGILHLLTVQCEQASRNFKNTKLKNN